MSRWFKLPSALRRTDVEDVTLSQARPTSPVHQRNGSTDLALVGSHEGHVRSSESEGSDAGSSNPPSSPSKNASGNGKRSLFKRGSKNLHFEKENGGQALGSLSIAKRVKSSLHLNSTVNSSNVSLTSPTSGEFGSQPFNSVKNMFGSKERRPSAMQMQAALRHSGSNDALNTEEARATSPTPTLQANQPMTPLDRNRQYGSLRSILRETNTPGSGQNVRFFSRDAYKVISPETSASVQNSSAEHPAEDQDNFTQKMQKAALEHGMGAMTPGGPDANETRFHSANASPNVFSSPDANADATQFYSANGTPHSMFSAPNVGNVTDYRSADSFPPSDGHVTHYESIQGSANAFSGATTFYSPGAMFSEGMPDATSTPYNNINAQSRALGLPNPPQLSGIFDHPSTHEQIQKDRTTLARAASARPTINTNMQANGNRASSHSTASSTSIETPNSVFHGSEKNLRRFSDQTQFHSMGDDVASEKLVPERASSSLGFQKVFKRESVSAIEGRMDFPAGGNGSINSNRMRSLSERVFSRPSVNDAKKINRDSNSSNGHSPSESPYTESPNSGMDQPDPFRADASNYYNSAAGFPNTPPRIGHLRTDSGISGVTAQSGRLSSATTSSIHSAGGRSQTSRTGSMASTSTSQTGNTMQDLDANDTVIALRTQLAFHQELTGQYERDLRSRDAHAQMMNTKVAAYEAEAEKRTKAMRAMRKRVAELEKAARAMEEQMERSVQESFERSPLEGASGEAVRALHEQILELGRTQNEMVVREREMKAENERLMQELREKDAGLERLRKEIEEKQSKGEIGVREARENWERREAESSVVIEQHREIELAWAEEQARMSSEANNLREQLSAKDEELRTLKQEVESQWANTEKMSERIEQSEKRREEAVRGWEECREKLMALEKRVEDMEVEWTESENSRAAAEKQLEVERQAKEEVEREREELRREVKHLNTQALGSSTSSASAAEIEQLRADRQSALDDAEALQQLLLQRETVNVESSRKLALKDTEIARLIDEVSSVRREYQRSLADADRTNGQLGESTKAQVANIAENRTLRDQVKSTNEELEKLRRTVKLLKQESADADVKITQLQKQHEQDVDDKLGLNIALDSKQQELELLKRSMGVKGTASSIASRASRRDSIASVSSFKTPVPARSAPSLSRPPSSMSDVEKSGKNSVSGAASSGGKVVLGQSTRANLVSSPPAPSMGVKKASPRSSLGSVTNAPSRANSTPTAPTRATSNATRTSSTATTKRVTSPSATVTARRQTLSSSMKAANMSGSESAMSDKENETPKPRTATTATRRMSMQPLAMPA